MKILKNTRINVSETDISQETSKEALLTWSIEIQRDIDNLKSWIDQAKNKPNEFATENQIKNWNYVLRIQGTLKQMVQNRISQLNKLERAIAEKRFEFNFVKCAKAKLSEEVFQNIKTLALEEARYE